MGRYRKYKSDKALREMVEMYFDHISRDVLIREEYNTGKKDPWGHWIYEMRAVTDDKGNIMHEREFVIPPTVGGLCAFLQISRDTWARYCDHAENPQFAETTEWAREQLLAWREMQLLRRGGKQLRGLIFDLQANYGLSEKTTVELGPRAAKAVAAGRGMAAEERQELIRALAEMKENDDGPEETD